MFLGGPYAGSQGVAMERIRELIKDREVYSVDPGRTVLDTVRYMVARNIGAVAVVQNDNLIGIFTERDLMKRVVSHGLDVSTTIVRLVMTPNPKTISPDDRILECTRLMKENNFRHLPICDGKKVIGLISLRDLILHDLAEKHGEVEAMRAYITQTS
jgi:CBS domain-containing protein